MTIKEIILKAMEAADADGLNNPGIGCSCAKMKFHECTECNFECHLAEARETADDCCQSEFSTSCYNCHHAEDIIYYKIEDSKAVVDKSKVNAAHTPQTSVDNPTPVGAIEGFQGNYRFLSNFAACPVCIEGVMYPSAENAYQAMKYSDLAVRQHIATLTPGQAKRFLKANPVANLRDVDRLDIMYRVLLVKFAGNYEMRQGLIRTKGRELVESNNWGDTFWGVCNGVGENRLGKMLMRIRDVVLANT
jgi:ribA/ribD-fused uncharacterized protein